VINKPIIGISTKLKPDSASPPEFIGVRVSYCAAIIAAGGVPFLLPYSDNRSVIEESFRRVDGVLLTGGEDVSPNLYGAEAHPSVTDCDPVRDSIEIDLARRALAEEKPILGICRGLQVINVALGGTLIQDICSCYQTEIQHSGKRFPEDWQKLVHPVQLIQGTRLAALLSAAAIQVNSLHHQAVDRLAPGLVIAATAPDGIIEGIEAADHPFFLAVQAHPEVLWPDIAEWRRLFEAFVDACA